MKIKKGDTIIVISGKSKGTTGKVARVISGANRVLVEGVNKVSIRQKPKKRGEKGQIVQREATIHISNVMLLEGKKGVRSGAKVEGDKKVRISKKTGKAL